MPEQGRAMQVCPFQSNAGQYLLWSSHRAPGRSARDLMILHHGPKWTLVQPYSLHLLLLSQTFCLTNSIAGLLPGTACSLEFSPLPAHREACPLLCLFTSWTRGTKWSRWPAAHRSDSQSEEWERPRLKLFQSFFTFHLRYWLWIPLMIRESLMVGCILCHLG